MLFKSEDIFNYINAPIQINSLTHINQLVTDATCYTLIEEPFFKAVAEIVKKICVNKVEGDIVMVGVFKGGAALYIKSLFIEFGFTGKLWMFDSFKGFNRDLIKGDLDKDALNLFGTDELFAKMATKESVHQLFKKFEIDQNMEIVEGFIEDTLDLVDIKSIAFLHIDVDCYEPTLFALEKLYPKVSKDGWCILDDYNVPIFGCKSATDHYRKSHSIYDPIMQIGNYPVGWKKSEQ
jgi:O-methyltransferase